MLDVACGGGRHTVYLQELGHPVTAVDIDTKRVRAATGHIRAGTIDIVEADLEHGDWPFPDRRFDGVVVVNYLYRPLLPLLADSLAPGGILLYDTFAVGNERFGKPANPDYLLEPGELLREFGSALEVLAYEHGEMDEPKPAVRQRICARHEQ